MRSRQVSTLGSALAIWMALVAGAFNAMPLPGQEPAAAERPAPATPGEAATPAQAGGRAPASRPGGARQETAAPSTGAARQEVAAPPSEAPQQPAAPAGGGAPQETTPAGVQAQPSEIDSLLARVHERFQVYPLSDGLMLLPKYEAPNVQSVQVSGGTIAINGRTAAGREIPALLGEDAPLVLRLSYLPPEQLAQRASQSAAPGAAPADTAAARAAAPTGTITGADTAGAQAAPTPPRPPEPEEINHDLDRGAHRGDQVRFGGDVEVEEGQTVTGDAVSIGGNVDVAGTVLGDAVSVGGTLRLHDTARVHGDAVSVGGRLERAPGAQVLGQTTTVGMSFPHFASRGFAWNGWNGGGVFHAVGHLLFTLLWIALLLILGSIFILFLSRPVDRVEANLRASPLKAGVVGFLAQLLFLPAYVIGLVLLVITIIGIPIAVLWAVGFFIVGFVAALFGFTAVARASGNFFSNRMGRPLYSPYVALFIGLLILFVPKLIGNLFGLGPGLMDFLSVLFFIIGSVVLYLAFTVGFGAVILTRFGTRTTWSGEPPAGYGALTPPPTPAPAPAGEPLGEPSHRSLPEAPTARGAAEPTGRIAEGYGDDPHAGPERNDRPPPV